MKKTAKIFSLLLAILMLAASLALFAACGDSYDEEITVYNWEDYIYSKTELQNDFNEYYKVKTGKPSRSTIPLSTPTKQCSPT